MNIEEETTMFPDYERLFGRFAFMAKHIEREIGINHFRPKPLLKQDLQEITDKENKAQKHPSYLEEKSFLEKILQLLKVKIADNKKTYTDKMSEVIQRGNRLPGIDTFSDDPVMKAKVLARWAASNINQYSRAQSSPYFGKVIFQSKASENEMELYFGKAAVDLEGENARVIDWRAPISDLYYKYTGIVKDAFFRVEDKEIHGELKLKRQITVEDGKITMISDGGLTDAIREIENAEVREDGSDEILISNLDKSAHKRLGEIVATIQGEQNEIIRAPIDKITLVQGVAGGGKTTIALHRLAYLLYNNPEEIRPENVLVIAPNDIFLDYISGILPDLGVEYIKQTTVEDYLLANIDLPSNISVLNKMEISAKAYEDNAFDTKIENIRELKGDLQILDFIKDLKISLENIIVESFNNTPYSPTHSKKVDHSYIRSLFYEFRNLPWEKRKEYISSRIETIIRHELTEMSMNSTEATNRIRSELQNINTYLAQINYPDLLEAYKMLFKLHSVRLFLSDKSEFETIIKDILEFIDSGILYADDLPILSKISELYKERKSRLFDYVVIDEAQDLTSVELEILRENTKPNAMCIVGDINQTIHSKGHLQTLEEQIATVFGDDSYSFHKLLKSYRSTIEITTFANQILQKLKASHVATPVIRHGQKPNIVNTKYDDLSDCIGQIIHDSEEKGRKSIAITSRSETFARELYDLLKPGLPDISYISDEDKDYNIGTHVLPSYLTKGLEFDTVIVVNEKELKKDATNRELRLQYVMYTRALHELNVVNLQVQ